jgi:tetratricopeptide (TPR) repeat protein
MLRSCIFGDLRPGAPDEDSIGTCQFFGGLSLSALGRFDEALQSFAAAMETTWYLTDKNQILCLFAIGKVYQRQGMHAQAIDHFSQALEILPDWEDNAYIHFRRAWSYKVIIRRKL